PSVHEESLFEYWWRTGISPPEAEGTLLTEAAQRTGYFSGFLFSLMDYWYPASDDRAVRRQEILAAIPQIVDRYARFLKSSQKDSEAGVLLVTGKDPRSIARPVALTDDLISTGRAAGVTMYAYRQHRAG